MQPRQQHNAIGTSGSSKAKLGRAIHALFEPMESRRMMSSTLTISPSNAGDSIVLDVTANGGVIKMVNGVQTNYSAGQWTDIVINALANEPITIRGSVVPISIYDPQAPLLTIGGPAGVQKIEALVDFHGTSGHLATVNINDTGDGTGRNASMTSTGNGLIDIQNFAPAIIELNPDAIGVLNITTGGGSDTFAASANGSNTTLNFNSAGGTDTVIIGGGNAGTQGVLGPVNIYNTPALTHLVIDDSAWDDSFNLLADGDGTFDSVIGMTQSPLAYKVSDVADVTVKLPSAGSVMTVLRTDKPLNLIGNHSGLLFNDDFVFGGANGMSGINAPVTLSNPVGIYFVELNDQNDPSARLIQVDTNPITQLNSVTGMSAGAIQWDAGDGVNLTLNTSHVGGNGVVVRNVDANNIVTINGTSPIGGPNDVLTIGNSGNVQGIAGALKIQNSGYSSVTIDDSSDVTARSAALDVYDASHPNYTWSLAGLSPGDIYFNAYDVSSVAIKGGSGGNSFIINDTGGSNLFGGTPINLFAGSGSDAVKVYGTVTGNVVNIEGQSGLDTVNIGRSGHTTDIRGAINVTNAGAYTQLTVDNSADSTPQTITLDAPSPSDNHPWGKITGIAPAAISYRAFDMKDPLTLKAGSGGNTILINNTPVSSVGFVGGNTINLFTGTGTDNMTVKAIGAGTTLNIDGQNGTDIVTVGNNGNMQGVLGTVNLANKNGFENVTLDNSVDAANRTVTIGALGAIPGNTQGSITGLAPGIVNFVAADVLGFTIDGGSGTNAYTVTGTPTTQANGFYGPTLTLNAGAGADVVNVLAMGAGTGLKINGQASDDTLTVDYSAGGMPLSHTITFDGGTPGQFGDSLAIKGSAGAHFDVTAGHVDWGALGHVGFSNLKALYLTGGTYNVNNDLALPALAAQTAATNVLFNASQTIGQLYLDAAHAAVASGGGKVLGLQSLNVVNNAQLDLADNSMIVDYTGASPLNSIRSMIKTGFANGAWNGAGISSSLADAVHGLGYGEASAVGVNTFAGRAVDSTAVLVKYTWYGDANLDGQVDVTDLGKLATNWQKSGSWTDGDFSYDGFVDVTDLGKLATNWQQGVGNPLLRGGPVAVGSVRVTTTTSLRTPSPFSSNAIRVA